MGDMMFWLMFILMVLVFIAMIILIILSFAQGRRGRYTYRMRGDEKWNGMENYQMGNFQTGSFRTGSLRMRQNPRVREIIGLFGGYEGSVYPLYSGMSCTIGRDSSCNIQIYHRDIARIHCTVELSPDGRSFHVIDRSVAGTFYQNQKLPKGIRCQIPAGAVLALGGADNVILLQ